MTMHGEPCIPWDDKEDTMAWSLPFFILVVWFVVLVMLWGWWKRRR
jgi:hypothetical protein